MNPLQILGLALALLSAVLFYLSRYRPVPIVAASGAPGKEQRLNRMELRLLEHAQRTRDLFCHAGNAVAVLSLLLALLLLFVSSQPARQADPGHSAPVDIVRPAAPPPAGAPGRAQCDGACERAEPAGTGWLTSGVVLTVIVLLAGVVLLLARNYWARGVGTVAVLTGLCNGYLFKDVKIDDLVKFEIKLDKLGFEFKKETRNDISLEIARQLTGFGPQRFAPIAGFELGKAALLPSMTASLDTVCRRWKEHGGAAQQGMLLIIGSADRVRLAGSLIGQYDSNVGLARARAERVKSHLATCGVPDEQMVTVVAGPRNTPEQARRRDVEGFPEDRSVVVWALWNSTPEKARNKGA